MIKEISVELQSTELQNFPTKAKSGDTIPVPTLTAGTENSKAFYREKGVEDWTAVTGNSFVVAKSGAYEVKFYFETIDASIVKTITVTPDNEFLLTDFETPFEPDSEDTFYTTLARVYAYPINGHTYGSLRSLCGIGSPTALYEWNDDGTGNHVFHMVNADGYDGPYWLNGGINFGFLSGVGSAAFNTLKNSVGGLISEIDSSNAAWKTFEGNMGIIGASTSEIESAKKAMQDYAQKTVYSSSDMAQTYAQLAAVGVKNTDKLVQGFGGLAGAAENPQQAMKTLSQQATQMAAKPTVAWADFKLMLEQTPAGMAAVAKAMGMTTSELVTAVQDGKVQTEDFFNTIAEVGGDANGEFYKMATQAKTVGQAMDGLKETIGNKLTPAFDVLSQVGIKAVNGLADMLGGIDAQALADKVSSAVATAG
jgi:tape measure domain-containing protein